MPRKDPHEYLLCRGLGDRPFFQLDFPTPRNTNAFT
jgi:hypothetical protein